MSARVSLQTRIQHYLAERRRLGFQLHSRGTFLASFARFVAGRRHRGPLTVDLMTDWVRQGKGGQGSPGTWARRLARLRHFIRYLKQFEPETEMPEASIFGPEPGRVAPHIYREEEIVELLAAARGLGPRGSLRPATFETLFGLMASTGLRISEAIHLRDADIDLKHGLLTVLALGLFHRPRLTVIRGVWGASSRIASPGGRMWDGDGMRAGGSEQIELLCWRCRCAEFAEVQA